MTKKKKSNSTPQKKAAMTDREMFVAVLESFRDTVLESFRVVTASPIDKRKELLARVAGSVAAGLVTSPSESIASPSSMATAAVDIADEILKKAGIPSVESSAESSSSSDVGVGAAA